MSIYNNIEDGEKKMDILTGATAAAAVVSWMWMRKSL